jgi:membrane peptidoglycan carboxypeptidase
MMAAATRSYLDGPETLGVQQRILSTYLNSTPLSSRLGYGEIIGIGDGLWAWYGTDLREANRMLAETDAVPSPRKAEIYKQMLSLLLAQRRPSYYLVDGRKALEALTNNYLQLLSDAGIVDGELRNAALHAELNFLADPPSPAPVSFVDRKAAASVRMELLRLLGTPSLYDLDRLDVAASTTFDAAAQQHVSDVLVRLGNREQVKALGLVGQNLLGTEDPARLTYSVVVYERGADRNFVRVHADSLNQPFDLNSGAKLILGSTAKLRTLITYLGIVNQLHDKYENMASRQLLTVSAKAGDALTRWAAAYLAIAADRSLQPMLNAAMQRRYSASPAESFFTGGGMHVFENFEKSENRQVPTVEDALVHSINLAFIRVMRDVSSYYIADAERAAPVAEEPKSDARQAYLKRFADQEGRTYLNHFYDDLRARKPDEMLSYLAARAGRTPNRLAIVYRSLRPEASVDDLRSFLGKQLPKVSLNDRVLESLYENSGPDRYSLADRAYLARVHPLQLWLAAYLQDHAGAPRAEILKASDDERQEAYSWLFTTRSARKQDVRIGIVSEQDAFNQILKDWRNQGYPFESLVPSLATAIGSSGDRPDALAELMGIIMNDGVQLPTAEIEQLHFAADTPYETRMALTPTAPKRVFAPEIARTVRRALMNVVSEGTGTRFRGAYVAPDGRPLVVGGKTGTGDNRLKSFSAGKHLVDARVVDRTATFVFFLGERFYGTITAYVVGPEAGKYHFTSALAVQLLKSLTPQLQPLLDMPEAPDRLAATPPGAVPQITFVSGASNAVPAVSKALH